MGALRTIALGILWLLAAVGIACGLVWGATAAGLIKPLVVISGSMEPEIMTGDLVIDMPVPAKDLRVGDVVSLPSTLTHNLVTHRIRTIAADADTGYTVTLKGDANEFEDALDYTIGAEVWAPRLQFAGVGTVILRLTTPAVAVPLLVGIAGLLGIVWLLPTPDRATRRRSAVSAADAAPASAPTTLTRRQYRAAVESLPT